AYGRARYRHLLCAADVLAVRAEASGGRGGEKRVCDGVGGSRIKRDGIFTDSLVNKRHLRAFNITQDKFWFAFTLELQLASLGLCKACRGFPALRVRVEEETPPT
ncbi:unnamed protein product, partial [Ectocarpus sp. 6 AP-2014]